jgi:hypothetical protein
VESSEAKLDDSFEDWQGAKIENCEDLVYKFELWNTTELPIQFRIKLKPKKADSEINLYWPVTGIRGSLAAHENVIVGLLHKLRPTSNRDKGVMLSELDKMDIKMSWKVDDAKVALAEASRTRQAERAENKKASKNEKKGVSFNDDVHNIPNETQNAGAVHGPVTFEAATDTYGFNAADFAGDGDEKSCGACTFLNPMSATKCVCCDTPF